MARMFSVSSFLATESASGTLQGPAKFHDSYPGIVCSVAGNSHSYSFAELLV